MSRLTSTQRTVLTGDVAVLVLLTIVGFVTHETIDAIARIIVTVVAALLAWALVAPFLRVYDAATIEDPAALWRVALAWLLAGPLATFLRGMALNRDIPWRFVLVTILINAFGLLAWRTAFGWAQARRARKKSGEAAGESAFDEQPAEASASLQVDQ